MLELSTNPWDALSKIARLYPVSRLDVLTGFIGPGFYEVLNKLGIRRGRIVIGWDGSSEVLTGDILREILDLPSGIQLRYSRGLHAKVFLVPGHVVAIGSANFTRSGFERLRECLVLTDDRKVVAEASALFEEAWSTGRRLRHRGHSVARSGTNIPPDEWILRLGAIGTRRESPFSVREARASAGTTRAAVSNQGKEREPVIRLCAYTADWLHPKKLDKWTTVNWTTGPQAKPGDIQVFGISRTIEDPNPKVRARLQASPGFDAIHSIWRVESKSRKTRGRWKYQAKMKLIARLETPVPKSDLVSSRILPTNRWPQSQYGKILDRDTTAKSLLRLATRRNPQQADVLRAALGR